MTFVARPRYLPFALPLAFTLSTICVAQTPAKAPAEAPIPSAISTVPGMLPVPDPANLYSETTAAKMNPALANDLPRVYVPHIQSNDIYVIDPTTFQVIGKFRV